MIYLIIFFLFSIRESGSIGVEKLTLTNVDVYETWVQDWLSELPAKGNQCVRAESGDYQVD